VLLLEHADRTLTRDPLALPSGRAERFVLGGGGSRARRTKPNPTTKLVSTFSCLIAPPLMRAA
jgi:hypothetical protein